MTPSHDVVIQFDIDGVLCDFVKGYLEYANVIYPGMQFVGSDKTNTRYGTHHILGALDKPLWAKLVADPTFWRNLPASEPYKTFDRIDALATLHRVYFVTNRPGVVAKWQTEEWLRARGIHRPTVVVSDRKGEFARAVRATHSIEDKAGNASYIDYHTEHATKSYLLARPYNRFDPGVLNSKVVRVDAVADFLDDIEAA